MGASGQGGKVASRRLLRLSRRLLEVEGRHQVCRRPHPAL